MKDRKKGFLSLLICIIVTLAMIFTTGFGEDLSSTASQMLQTLTPKIILLKGMQKETRLVTINIAEFSQYSIDGYAGWVEDNYADENTLVLVFSGDAEIPKDGNEVKTYLCENGYEDFSKTDFDWTNLNIRWKKDSKKNKKIKKKSELQIGVSYPLIHEAEGFNVEMEYRNGDWEVDDMNPTYQT